MSERPRRRFFRLPFKPDSIRREVDEELEFHLEMRSERYRRDGLTPKEAREEARRRFGDVDRVREEVEEMMMRKAKAMRTNDLIDNARRDVAFAARQIMRNPTFSIVAVLTIALGIGSTTSIFSVVDGILLRPLPYEQPEELVMVWADYTRVDVVLPDLRREWLSWPNFSDFRDEVSGVEAVSTFQGWPPTLTGAGDAEQLNAGRFSYGMFSDVFAVAPALGRGFLPEEDVPDGPSVVILSDGFWKRAFGGDPSVVGSDVLLDGRTFTVLGVMPETFRPPSFLGADLWSLLQFDDSNGGGRGAAFLRAVGRLGDGVPLERARAQATELGVRLEQEYPGANSGVGYNIYPLRFDLVQQTSGALWILFGAVGFVLLISCVNVANLLLARGASRGGELAVRVALGAGRGRILNQLLTESLLLALLGGAIGVGLAFVGTEILIGLAPQGTPRIDEVALDARILAFAASVTALAGLFFGALPALRASRAAPAATLGEGERGAAGVRAGRLRNALVIGQVALALVLLVGAGLLIRSFQNLQKVDLGFTSAGVLTLQTQMPQARYPDAPARHEFMRSVEERLSAIPGVASVGSITNLPLAGQDGDTGFQVEGEPPAEPGQPQSVWFRRITPGYLDAMGIELLAGRGFTLADTDEQPQVVLINETLANDYYGGEAVGKRINVNDPGNPTWREIVGVVADIKNFGIRAESRNAMYVPFYQVSAGFMFTVVRTNLEPTSIMGAVRREVAAVDPAMAVARVQPMSEWVGQSLGSDRFTTILLTGFAVVALLLSVVGLYGVVSYSVSTRLREMGIRIAIGAGASSIHKLVLRWSLRLALIGIVLGGVGALVATRLMEGLLFGVRAADPTTFVMTAAVMAASALGASMIPAIRATRVDPVKVLKAD